MGLVTVRCSGASLRGSGETVAPSIRTGSLRVGCSKVGTSEALVGQSKGKALSEDGLVWAEGRGAARGDDSGAGSVWGEQPGAPQITPHGPYTPLRVWVQSDEGTR